jgi:hypothetical protein
VEGLIWPALGALTIATVLSVAMLLALAQRVRAIHEAVNQSAPRDPTLPQPGDRVGEFEVVTTRGETVTSSTLDQGTTLVGIFTPGCPTCARVRSQLLERPPTIPFLAFVVIANENERDDARTVADSLGGIGQVAVALAGESATRAFRDAGFPTLVRVERGNVIAAGHRLGEVLP